MKPDISAFLDGELEEAEASRAIDALRSDIGLQEAWNTYHLIGDTLRRNAEYSPNFSQRVMARLASEPVQFHPSTQPKRTPLSVALPLAAAVMGMAVVGWLALSLDSPRPIEVAAKSRPAQQAGAETVNNKMPPGTLNEYLVAHQVHSPIGIQGVASYVRTVSEIHQGGRR